jgi:hypothetical protein
MTTPTVTLKFRADTAEALARIETLSTTVSRQFGGALVTARAGTQALGGSLRELADIGGRVGDVFNSAAGGFAAGGGIAAAAAGALTLMRSAAAESDTILSKIAAVNANLEQQRRGLIADTEKRRALEERARQEAEKLHAGELARLRERADLASELEATRRGFAREQLDAAAAAGQALRERLATQLETDGRGLAALRARAEAEQQEIADGLRAFTAAQHERVAAAQDALEKISRQEHVTLDALAAAQDRVTETSVQANTLIAQAAEESAQRSAIAWAGFAERSREAFGSFTRSAVSLFEGLGPGFEAVSERLRGLLASDEAAAKVRQLDEALRQNLITQFEHHDALGRVRDQLAGVTAVAPLAAAAIETVAQAQSDALATATALPVRLDAVTASYERLADAVGRAASVFNQGPGGFFGDRSHPGARSSGGGQSHGGGPGFFGDRGHPGEGSTMTVNIDARGGDPQAIARALEDVRRRGAA